MENKVSEIEQKQHWFECLEEWYKYTTCPVINISQILYEKELSDKEKLEKIKEQSDKCFGYQPLWKEKYKYFDK